MQNELTPEVLEELENILGHVRPVNNPDFWRQLFAVGQDINYYEAYLLGSLRNHAPALIAAARDGLRLKVRLAEMNDNSHPCFYCGEWMVNHIGENLMCENCGVDQSAAHTSTQERLKRLEWEA